jgi:pimeloyl-ACP methyl ester carboxylesterase
MKSLQAMAIATACSTLMVAACSQRAAAPEENASGDSAPTAPAPADGAPRIAMAPDGVHIDYRVYGRGDPAIVFIHGWSCDANYWQGQVANFRQRYTVVAVNLAGHGASTRNRQAWSIGAFGDDVAAAVQSLPNRQLVLVGHSMGGPVALEAARRLGDRVIGIVGVDTFQGLGASPVRTPEIDQALAAAQADPIGFTREFVTTRFFPEDADPAFVRRIADDMALAPPEVSLPSLIAIVDYDAAPTLAGIEVPIVAINADLDGPLDVERIQRAAPTFRARIMSGHGHFLMMEDPAAFNALLQEEIDAFVREARAPGP